MDRRAKTRKEKEVWEACNVLEKNKSNITYFAIGEQLIKLGYKRGSNSDIRRYLTTWKKHHTEPVSSMSPSNAKKGVKSKPVESYQEHEPLRNTIESNDAQKHHENAQYEQLIRLAKHYADQFDRMLKINDLLRQENQLLKKRVKQTTPEVSKSKPKPRYRLKATFEGESTE